MFAMPRLPTSVGCLAALVAATIPPAPGAAADWQRSYLEPAVQAWMGMVTMLAEDGEREERKRDRDGRGEGQDNPRGECRGDCKGECVHCRGQRPGGHEGDKHHGGHHRPGMHGDHGHHAPHHAPMGPPRPEGPRADAISMLHDISGRLARIERMLAARGPGGPPAGGPGW